MYTTGNYHTSYATAGALTGPYPRAYRPLMTTASLDGTVNGPGGADVVDDRIFFRGHLSGGGRGMSTAPLGWDNWTQVSVDVNLAAGVNTIRNTIRLQFRGRWAELDYLEVA